MSYLLCRFIHGIEWHHGLIARTKDGVTGTYGMCSCGKEYFKSFDHGKILSLPSSMKAFRLE